MISLTYTSIAEVVMARAALRRHLHGVHPSMLTADHREALNLLISNAFATLTLALMPFVDDAVDNTAAQTLTLELRPASAAMAPESGAEPLARCIIEAALVAYTLHLAYEGADEGYSQSTLEMFSKLVVKLRMALGSSAPMPVKPVWY